MSVVSHGRFLMRGLDAGDKDEVEARKARLRQLKEEVAQRERKPFDQVALSAELLNREMGDKPSETGDAKNSASRPVNPNPLRQRVIALGRELGASLNARQALERLNLPETKLKQVQDLISKLRYEGTIPRRERGSRSSSAGRAAPDPDPQAHAPDLRTPDPDVIRNQDPKADAELLVIQRVLAQFARLPDAAATRRVLAYLSARIAEEGGNAC